MVKVLHAPKLGQVGTRPSAQPWLQATEDFWGQTCLREKAKHPSSASENVNSRCQGRFQMLLHFAFITFFRA